MVSAHEIYRTLQMLSRDNQFKAAMVLSRVAKERDDLLCQLEAQHASQGCREPHDELAICNKCGQ